MSDPAPAPSFLDPYLDGQRFIQQLSIDCVIIGYSQRALRVLVPKLDLPEDIWALPSGFIRQREDVNAAARRIIEHRTGMRDFYLDQFRVYGSPDRIEQPFFNRLIALMLEKEGRDPGDSERMAWLSRRFVSIGYYALVDLTTVRPRRTIIDASIEWLPVADLPGLMLDHNAMIEAALETVRLQFDDRHLAFHLLPEQFTMKEVRQLYETVFGRPFSRTNFQKKILDMEVLERTAKKFTGASNRAPYLYRLRARKRRRGGRHPV